MADFKLGRIKFKWRGDWSTSTGFLIDDVVKYGGNTYVCIVNHTSQSTSAGFYTDLSAAKWSLQAESLFFKGTYAASTHYKLNDVVKYGARQYRCTTQHTSAAAVSGVAILNAANFELYIDATDYKGAYATSTYYKVNDVVKYGGSLYICITAHTSSASASSFDETKFDAYTEGLQFEDSWSSGTAYQKGDVVTYGGYAYVAAQEVAAGQAAPLASSANWDLVVPGFNATGDYSAGTAYKTGDTINFGGWAYVCVTDTSAGQSPSTHSAKWTVINEGFNFLGTWSNVTTYFKGDVVEYSASSYVSLTHSNSNITPGTDANSWSLLAQGDSNAVLEQRGDIVVRSASAAARLPLGVAGSQLTSNGLDPVWKNPTNRNILYVANDGSDSNPGTELLPFKTIKYGLTQCGRGDVTDFDTSTITGGTGGTAGTYDVTGSGGSGTGFTARVIIDGSSQPIIDITDGGKNYTAGNTITISSSQIGGTPATNITFTVKSVNAGDVLYVRNGSYREQTPLRVPPFVTIRGDSLRSTEIRPATGSSTTIATVTRLSGGVTGKIAGTYTYVEPLSTSGSGTGIRIHVVQDGSSNPTIEVMHGGYGYAVSDTITFGAAAIGASDNLVISVTTLENNNAGYVMLCANGANVEYFAFRGFTGLQTHSSATYTGGHGAVMISLDPQELITNTSPYIQNCTSFSDNAVGIKIDGLLHASATSNRSILANDFTQINSDGLGVWALNGGRGEMVSVFTYYCQKSFYTSGGGFLRGLNCSSAYGELGIVAEGELAAEVPVFLKTRGRTINYNTLTVSGAGASEFEVGQTLVGGTSGATGTIFRLNISGNKLHLDPATGNFAQGETVTVTRLSAGTFTFAIPNTAAGISGNGAKQSGFFLEVESSAGAPTLAALAVSNPVKLGDNIKLGTASTYYIVSGFTNQNTSTQTATIRLVSEVSTLDAVPDNTLVTVTRKYSNCRFTGHDFLDIGTGGFADTNYPNEPLQPADQADEVEFNTGGRVYWTSSDQGGDFRVGDLFRIQQATGIATLNADAFDLSGLTELQLGSIGAQLGATINEFSTDEAMSGNSNTAVPTENALVGYIQRDNMGTGIFVPPTGTTAERPTSGFGLHTGGLRFNTSLTTWEGYNGVQWTGLGGGNPWSTVTADGSTTFTAAANDRIFVNTSGGACTITLPASPQTGDQVRFLDLASTFDTNNLTIGRNSLKIMGLNENLIISNEDAAIGLVYTGSTYGWKLIEN